MKDILREALSTLKALAAAPLVTLICLPGIILVLSAFIDFTGASHFSLISRPDIVRTSFGLGFIISSIVLYLLASPQRIIQRKINLTKGIVIKVRSITIRITLGDIAEVNAISNNCALVLPANTSFIDDCLTDRMSALGSFFLTHFPDMIPNACEQMRITINKAGHKQASDGLYPPGTTIVMPPPFDRPCRILITASTTRKPQIGITSGPTTVCECIRNIFAMTADRKIDTLYIPILGSGHGGLDKQEALMFIVMAIRHYARSYHHIKTVEIVVWRGDAKQLCNTKGLRSLSLIGG